MLKRFCVLIAIIYLSLVLSCSQSTMEPGEVYARVLFVQTGESQATPRFSLFFAYTNTAPLSTKLLALRGIYRVKFVFVSKILRWVNIHFWSVQIKWRFLQTKF